MAPQRERSRPQADRAKVLIAELWGDPPERVAVTNSELVAKVSKAAKDQGYPVPGRDSILRAANRATDRHQRK
jgi:hypothetical protein